VIKGGQILVEQGELRRHELGTTLYAEVAYDDQYTAALQSWFNSRYSIRFSNYIIQPEELSRSGAQPC
jgi:formylmethanofuran dehydrogenase subunit A